jgi:hypothetical protein
MKEKHFTSTGEAARGLAFNSKGKAITSGTCSRCGGTGKFSWCAAYGDTCFGCGGTGKETVRAYTEKEYKALVKRREKAAAKREKENAARAERCADENAKRDAENAAEAEAGRILKEPIVELLKPLADEIEDGKGRFCDSIARSMRSGELPRGRGWDLVCEILAKYEGRSNSKAYAAEYARVEAVLDRAREAEEIAETMSEEMDG